MNNYKNIVYIEPDYSEEELAQRKDIEKQYAISRFYELSEGKQYEDKERIWMLLTSRGEDRLMFGEMPKEQKYGN